MNHYAIGKAQFDQLIEEHTVVPVWRELVADLETPVSAYMKLAGPLDQKAESASFLLESVEHGERWGRFSFIGLDPFLVVTSRNAKVRFQGEILEALGLEAEPKANPLEAVRDLMSRLKAPDLEGLPPLFAGAVGYLGFDVSRYLEELPQTTVADVDTPEIMLMLPKTLLAFDHLRQTLTIVSNVLKGQDYESSIARTDELVAKLGEPLPYVPLEPRSVELEIPASNMSREQYMDSVEKGKKYILAGDIFQVVLSQRFSKKLETDPFSMYRTLRLINPSPYMFFLNHPKITVLGSSPEPLVKVQGRRMLQRPIAGTHPRGATPDEDLEAEKRFVSDEKERAEHVMLVDLARNDLGRVATPGSVEVEELMIVERYSHVMHLVSQVAAELQPGLTGLDALYASFPAGTVSGAPKIRAMEIIDELEPTRRGPYAGVVGYIDLSGNLDTCIALRTAYVVDGIVYIQAGAGIVADSDPATEWQETVNKASAMLTAIAAAEASFK